MPETSDMPRSSARTVIPLFILAAHAALHAMLGIGGWLRPFELLSLLLLGANLVIALCLWKGSWDLPSGTCTMLLIAGHGLIGQRLAPDSLTSGAMLTVNILIVYVGVKIYEHLSRLHFAAFAGSYLILFYIFLTRMQNAEALFLLFLMGLAATARDFKLLTYFWAIVLSFTACQPYAWETTFSSFLILTALFSIRDSNWNPASVIFLVGGMALLLFVLLPVIVLMAGEDPRNVVAMLKSESVRDALRLTAVTATISTVILAAFCVPLAYALSRLDFKGKSLLLALADLPIIVPQSAAGLAILKVFGKQQYLGGIIFDAFGIRFDGSVFGICPAQIFVAMPFILKGSLAAFESVPVALEGAARTLGASSFSAFKRVALPLAMKGVVAAAILAWARAAGEFGAVLFVAPYPETAPIAVYNLFNSVGLVQTAPLVTTILLFSLAMFLALQILVKLAPGLTRREGSGA